MDSLLGTVGINEKRFFGVEFPASNEDLFFVEKYLAPVKGDNIYSILGSGDVPFLCLDKGASVYAVDHNFHQIEYVQNRIQALRNGNKKFFLSLGDGIDSREKYVCNKLSSVNVKNNLKTLEIVAGDLFVPKIGLENFNKVYVSNALGHVNFRGENIDDQMYDYLEKFIGKFEEGTLFYLTFCGGYGPQGANSNSRLDFRWLDTDEMFSHWMFKKK
ncbi:hypothetical protein HOD29_04525 [archaeon]|jgi:hypothetical protein|nr:hypothetical protein [archaeon]